MNKQQYDSSDFIITVNKNTSIMYKLLAWYVMDLGLISTECILNRNQQQETRKREKGG